MYEHVKLICGVAAALTAVGCTGWMRAGGDLPRAGAAAIIIVITVCTTLSAGAWVIERAVAKAVDQALAEATVRWQATAIAGLRSVLETEIREMIDTAVARSVRNGMVMDAAGRIDSPVNGTVTKLYERS